jgi:tetratricopeptide (TPR) repeat protein
MFPPRYILKTFLGFIILFAACGITFAEPLEDYLANPPVVDNPPWFAHETPEKMIPIYRQRFDDKNAKDREKGIAIANLAIIAGQMSGVDLARPAAADLLERIVMPNLDYTLAVEKTNACSWRQMVMTCANTYRNLGKFKESQNCLILFRDQIKNPDDKDMAIYLLAYEYAKTEEYQTSIDTIMSIATESRFANDRQKLVKYWTNKKAEKERKEKQLGQKNIISEQKSK